MRANRLRNRGTISEPMHVLHTIAGLSQSAGGTTAAVLGYSRALAEADVRVTVAIPAGCGRSNEDGLSKVRVVEEPEGASNGIVRQTGAAFGHYVRDVISETRPDVVHVHALWDVRMHAACRAARRCGIPYVLSTHGMLEPWALRYHRWRKQLALGLYQRRDLRQAACLHATADSEADGLRCFVKQGMISSVPIGIDWPGTAESESQATRERTALFLSRIHPVKGLLNLVEAWRRLRPVGWQLVIAGPDECGHRSEVLAAVRTADLGEQVQFLGPLHGADKWRALARASLFVLPSFNENFGIVVPEALACGTPVITTTATPWRELQEHGCGWWIDVGVEPLVGALRSALAMDHSQRAAMGSRGQELVARKYVWPRIAGQLIALYEKIGAGAPRRRQAAG